MNRLFKTTVILGISLSFILIGCSFNIETYGLTRSEYKLVDKYYDVNKMTNNLKKSGYSDEVIELNLRAALTKIQTEFK